MALITRCCCCCSDLRTANVVIGISDMVGSMICVACDVYFFIQHSENNDGWLNIMAYAVCAFFCVWFLMGIVLLFGSVRKDKRIVLFRIIITAALLILGTIGLIVAIGVLFKESGFQGKTAGDVSGGILVTGLLWYLWVVTYSYLQELNQGTRNFICMFKRLRRS